MKRAESLRHLAIAILLAVCCSGCMLPIPHRRLHAYGVRGAVVSEADGSAIAEAVVADSRQPEERCHTDSDGAFRLRPIRGWHGAYVVDPICLSALPGWDVTFPGREVRVTAPGFLPTAIIVSSEPRGSYVEAGSLRLTPTGTDR